MAESKLKIMSMEFAVSAIKLCDSLKGHYSLVNQFERSATSVGANIHEANYGQSKADFISKIQIALKETAETEYWLRLLMLSEYIKDILLILLQARKYLLVPGCAHARNPHHKRPLF